MKVHLHLVEAITQALREIFEEGKYADKVIEKYMKFNRKWGSRDRKFFAEQVYGLVRWWRRDWYLLGEEPDFQYLQLARLWAIHQLYQGNELPDWQELRGLHLDRSRVEKMKSVRALRESIPDWLDQLGEQSLGSAWDGILASSNEPSTIDLRVNTLKTSREQLQKKLAGEEVPTDFIQSSPDGLVLRERKNVFMTDAFKNGHFEMQDRASQKVAPFMQLEKGFRVVDACAGAGGKSLHMAALMQNKGKILSLDIHEWKLKELKKRAARDGVDVIETRVIDSNKVIKRLEKTADRVLLDVPCSGLGVVRRNPDTKWKLTREEISELHGLQKQILSEYSSMTKVGGKLVYATCSFLPEENEKQVVDFLENSKGWELEEQLRINPDQGLGDGFFAARMVRKS